MAIYGIALLTLVKLLENTVVVQKWYADDGTAVGKLKDLHRLHDALTEHGPAFGYHITKCHLIAKKITWKTPRRFSRMKMLTFWKAIEYLDRSSAAHLPVTISKQK